MYAKSSTVVYVLGKSLKFCRFCFALSGVLRGAPFSYLKASRSAEQFHTGIGNNFAF